MDIFFHNSFSKYFLYFLCVWIGFEICFWFILRFVIIESLQKLSKPQKYSMNETALMFKILDSMDSFKTYTFDKFLYGFFRGASKSEILSGNYESFLAWAMYASHYRDLNDKQKEQVAIVVAEMQKRYGGIESGNNPKVKHICMTLERLSYIHRPLAFYIVVGITEIWTNEVYFRVRGFQRLSAHGHTYWYRPAMNRTGNKDPTKNPLVFYHGISPGWLAYAALVQSLSAHEYDRDVFLINLDCIKIKSLSFRMPCNEEHADGVADILKSHQVTKVSVVGHSFGTIAAAWFVKRHPELISHITLLDSVSLLLFFPDVAYAFLYRYPSTLVEWVIYLGAAQEITISYTLYRNFWWYNNLLFLEDIPLDIGLLIGISGADEVAKPITQMEYANQIEQYRKAKKAELELMADGKEVIVAPVQSVVWDNFSHGQILLSMDAQRNLAKSLYQNETLLKG